MCNGQLLPISQYQALYSLIGTTYGGDGQSTFALPDLRGRLGINLGTNASITYNLGSAGGAEVVTVNAAQVPTHTHVPAAQTAAGTVADPTGAVWATSPLSQYSTAASNVAMNTQSIGETGGNGSHNNMMPFFTLTFIIALQGIFPVRA